MDEENLPVLIRWTAATVIALAFLVFLVVVDQHDSNRMKGCLSSGGQWLLQSPPPSWHAPSDHPNELPDGEFECRR